MKKSKLKDILKNLDRIDRAIPIGESQSYIDQLIAGEFEDFKKSIQKNPTLTFLDDLNTKLEKFKRDFNLKPVLETIRDIQDDIELTKQSVAREFESAQLDNTQKLEELHTLVATVRDEFGTLTQENVQKLLNKIASIEESLYFSNDKSEAEGKSLKEILQNLEERINGITSQFSDANGEQQTLRSVLDTRFLDSEKKSGELADALEKLRLDVFKRLANIGGGNANRNIAVSGNTSVLSRYTDINLKAGSNISITYSPNDTTKYTDVTITSTGGGAGNPADPDKSVQFNNGGVFGGDPAFLWSASVLTIGQQGSVRGAIDLSGGSTGTVRVQVPSVAGNWQFTLPANDGNAGQYLLTDGNGITQWASVVATGGSGITRTTSIITANTTGGTTANTDYVYIATQGLSFTLPDASGNNNLYTIKNATASSILVTAIGGDTMDGSASVLVAINNQALGFISDGSNYRIV